MRVDRMSYWILVLLLGYISMVPFYALQQLSLEKVQFNLFKYLPFLLCVLLATARLIVVRRWGMEKTDWAIGVYLLCCCLSLVRADYPAIGALKLIYYSVTGVGLFYMVRSFDAAKLYGILRWVAWFSTGVGFYGIISHVWGPGFLWEQLYTGRLVYFKDVQYSRLDGTLGNPIILGGFICLTAPLLINEISTTPKGLYRDLLLSGMVAVAISLVLTIAKSAWLSAIFIAALWLGLSGYVGRKKIIQVGIAVAVVILLVEPVVIRAFPNSTERMVAAIGDRIESIQLGSYSVEARLELFEITAAEIARQPLLGLGIGNFTRVFMDRYQNTYQTRMNQYTTKANPEHTPDNMYLMFAVETGLFSLAAMLYFFCKSLAYIHRAFSTTRDRLQRLALQALFIGACGFLLNILFWDGLNQPATRILFWSLLGAACGLAQNRSEAAADP